MQCPSSAPPGQSRGVQHPPALLAALWATHHRVPLALLATRAHCWLVVNRWPTVGHLLVLLSTRAHCWLSWPPGHIAGSWSTTGHPLATRTTRSWSAQLPSSHGQSLVNYWSTIGPLLVNHWPSWPPGLTLGSWSIIGQLLVNHWLSQPPGHTADSWSTIGQPLALLATRAHHWLTVNHSSTAGHLLP